MLKAILSVGVGSFVGGVLRYLVSRMFHPAGGFPVATFIVNVAGCFLIGLLYGFFARNSACGSWCLALTTGLCGGFTTFSTFANESLAMLQAGNLMMFLIYVALSIMAGVAAVFLGYLVMR